MAFLSSKTHILEHFTDSVDSSLLRTGRVKLEKLLEHCQADKKIPEYRSLKDFSKLIRNAGVCSLFILLYVYFRLFSDLPGGFLGNIWEEKLCESISTFFDDTIRGDFQAATMTCKPWEWQTCSLSKNYSGALAA